MAAHGSSRQPLTTKRTPGKGVVVIGARTNTSAYIVKSFTAGALGAIVGGGLTHPIDLIKVRLQLAATITPAALLSQQGGGTAVQSMPKHNLLSMGLTVVRNEGTRALYRGLTAGLVRQVTFIGSKFTAYGLFKGLISKWNPMDRGNNISFTTKAVCGMLAGVVGGVSGNPADMIMVRMQADGRLPLHQQRGYKNVAEAMVRVVREEGLTRLWRGSGPTVARSIIITAAQLGIYDEAKDFGRLKFNLPVGLPLHTFASFASSFGAAIVSNPVDVCKTRIQSMRSQRYTGLSQCMYKIAAEEGPLSLYKGLTATFARQLPLNTIRFIAFEKFMTLFGVPT